MSWKQERDALIAQTMAFVQSVTGRTAEFGTTGAGFAPPPPPQMPLPAAPDTYAQPKAIAPLEPAKPVEPAKPLEPIKSVEAMPARIVPVAPRGVVPGEMANEIRARVAGFRAHQERFNREREEYFSQTLAKLKATLNEMPPPRAGK
jgi:hypothetical protein